MENKGWAGVVISPGEKVCFRLYCFFVLRIAGKMVYSVGELWNRK